MSNKILLIQEIQQSYDRLKNKIKLIPLNTRLEKNIIFTGGPISVADLVAYQIGWGKLLIGWYKAGLRHEIPQMPGEGFDQWNYEEIALHFYEKHHYDGSKEQDLIFQEVVAEILHIIETELQTGNLEKEGVWDWCTLKSGKKWPLSKWIKVNTSSPYKRAFSLL